MNLMARERILVSAAERYMRGEISLEEHNRIRREHRFDYRAACKALTHENRRRRRWWWPFG